MRHAPSQRQPSRLLTLICCALLCCLISTPSLATHAYAQFGDIKYPAGFAHFDWVNPAAPKGGEIRLVSPTREASFDKYNPFTLKGLAAPNISSLLFESLLTGTLDEPTTAYGLLAEDVSVPPDLRSATFRVNRAARFHNGKPVTAADVKYSFDTLNGPFAHPGYRAQLGDIEGATVLDAYTVRFDFKRPSAELPLLVGSLPIFSPDWAGKKNFDEVVTDTPIASGPYRIGRVAFGKEITYERDPNYWAQNLNVRRGMFNFQRVTYKVYKDNVAQTEAFKAGEFDYIEVFISRQWARTYVGGKFDSGELIRRELPSKNAADFQGYWINTRTEKLRDPRVRQALVLAMDFEWMNRQLFYNAYTRVRGYFNASDFEARGLPGADEWAILAPLKSQLAPEVFTQPVPLPPSTQAPNSLRGNLRQAKALLNAAGWHYRDGALRNAKGQAFTLEFLDNNPSAGRIATPYMQALAKLGIQAELKIVDFALLQKRLDSFDFEITSVRMLGREAPGSELIDRFMSQSAKTEGGSNLAGVQDPAVDALVSQALKARTRPELIAHLRALDRVLRWGHYMIPQWYNDKSRIAYKAKTFGEPQVKPDYYQPQDWVLSTWWRLP